MDAYGDSDGRKKKNRVAIIAVASLLLVAMTVAVTIGVMNYESEEEYSSHKAKEVNASMKAVKAICQPAEYQKTCIDSLSKAGTNTTDPKELIMASFNITMNHISNAVKKSRTLQELSKEKSGRDALRICRELMDYAIDDLKRAFGESNNFDITKIDKFVAELKVWLGGALTFQETCLEGFDNTTSKAGDDMRKALKTSMELTRNSLAIIDQIADVVGTYNIPLLKRRLLSNEEEYHNASEDGFPTWVPPEQRRILAGKGRRIRPNIIVAKDGSGKYKTINDALKAVPKLNAKPFVIRIKEGVYDEIVKVNSTNVVMIGDGPEKTRITGNRSFHTGFKTIETATFAAVGHGFIAKDIGFVNTAGAEGHQAVAMRAHSDMSVYYNCNFDGYQDTLYVHAHRQFYRDCRISGTIDFIFGNAQAVLQNCKIIVRKPLDNQYNAVTAQGRDEKYDSGAIVIQGSTITADPEYKPYAHKLKTYLGRPWKNFSRTIIMHSHIDDIIEPEGWTVWPSPGNKNDQTCYYVEYKNTGPGARDLDKRVKWPCIMSNNITDVEMQRFAPTRMFYGDDWIRQARVPYYADLRPK